MRRDIKIKWIFGVIILSASVLAAFQFFGGSRAAATFPVMAVDPTVVSDGVYPGDAELEGVRISLDVTVQNGMITNITIREHQNGIGFRAEKAVIEQIIQKQTNLVDVVTGASISSKLIMKSVENALKTP